MPQDSDEAATKCHLCSNLTRHRKTHFTRRTILRCLLKTKIFWPREGVYVKCLSRDANQRGDSVSLALEFVQLQQTYSTGSINLLVLWSRERCADPKDVKCVSREIQTSAATTCHWNSKLTKHRKHNSEDLPIGPRTKKQISPDRAI